jgi:trigger factor
VVAKQETQKLEKCQIRLTLTVPRDEVKKGYEALLKEYSKSVQIKGFRKGHVPGTVLERKFGEGLKEEAMGRIMEDAVKEALETVEQKPIGTSTPAVTEEPVFSLDADFTFSVTYDTFPEFELGSIEGIECEIPAVEVGAEDEGREMDDLRDRNALVIDKDEGAKAAKGDVATIDYAELDETGAEIAGTAREGFVFTVGSNQTLYDFDEDVIGMVKGDSKTVAKTFPADYRFPDLAGKDKKLRLALTQVKARKLPDLDDDFAQDVSEKYKTLADLKADIRKRLEARLADKLAALKEQQVIEALLARCPMELPESIIEAQLAARYRDFMGRLGADPKTFAKLLEGSGKTAEGLFQEWRPSTEKSIKTRLIIEKLLEREKPEASDEELSAEYAKIAERSGSTPEETREQYEKAGYAERVLDQIRENKLFDAIYAKGKEKKGKKTKFVDLFAENE